MIHRSTYAVCFALLLAGCSSAPTNEAPTQAADAGAPSDDTGDDPPPELGDLASTVCLPNGTTRDPNAIDCKWNSDCKQQPYTDNSDWDKGRWKKQCDAYSWMIGVSVDTNSHNSEDFWCAMRPDLTTSVGNWQNEPFNSVQRTSTSDWDVGYYKAECPLNQYVSGYSVNTSGGGTGSVANIRCVSGPNEGNNTSCHAVTFGSAYTGNAGFVDGSDDWSVGNFKLECAGNEHIAGISANASAGGRIHGIFDVAGGRERMLQLHRLPGRRHRVHDGSDEERRRMRDGGLLLPDGRELVCRQLRVRRSGVCAGPVERKRRRLRDHGRPEIVRRADGVEWRL